MEEKKENVQVSKQKKNKKLRNKIVIIFFLLALFIGYVILRGSFLEYKELGENYLSVYWTNVKMKSITLGIEFIILFISFILATNAIKKGLKPFFDDDKKEMPRLPSKSISFIISLIISGLSFSFVSQKIMLLLNKTSFGTNDPIFKIDISYYVFVKPFLIFLLIAFVFLVIALAIYTTIYNLIVFNKFFDGIDRKTLKESKLIKQLLFLLKLLIIGVAALIVLSTQNILFEKLITLKDEKSTDLYGAGITDIYVKMPGYIILAVIVVITVFKAIKYIKLADTKKVLKILSIVPIYLVCLGVVLLGYELIFVSSNELEREKKYIQYNIDATKTAYNINLEENNIQQVGTISLDQIENYQDLINNTAIVDKDTTLTTLNDKQTKSKYYTYKNSKIGLYNINGTKKLVYLSARELSGLNSNNYFNKTYKFTHGFGTVVNSASNVDEYGNIEYIQKDFDASNGKIKVVQPRIYYGTETNQTVITNCKNEKEFDYPISDTNNAENVYDGQGGINLNFIDRLTLALYKRNFKIAFSSKVSEDSKILINRNIVKRAKTLLPSLIYDDEPYQVITEEGKTIWIIDGYTVSSDYPYSQSTFLETKTERKKINYIKNSVKVIVDSYDGTVKFYITDRTDPIIMAYRNMYPDLFVDIDEQISSDIASHITYSEFLFKIQSKIIERYHNVKTDVLYRSNDVWQPATHATGKNLTAKGTEISPYYTMVKVPNSENIELGVVLPYTLYGKQSLTSYLVGTVDENGNNILKLVKFADDSNVLGTLQLDTQIEQNDEILSQIQSLNVNGTKLIRNMVVVPIDNTLLYVEPIYQVMLNESEVPILKKIVVASGNKVAIGNNLNEALKNLTSQYATNIEVSDTEDIDGLIEEIIKANNNLTRSNANNDWELIGTDIKNLQGLINKLEKLKKEEDEKESKESNNTVNNSLVLDNVIE